MRTNKDFEALRRGGAINVSGGIRATMETLDLVSDGDHITINGNIYRASGRASITESNKKFTKRKSYVAKEISLIGVTEPTWRGTIDYAYDDEFELSLSESRMPSHESGITTQDVLSKGRININGQTSHYDEKYYGIFEGNGHVLNVIIYEYTNASGGVTFEGYIEGETEIDNFEMYEWKNIVNDEVFVC